MAQDVTSVVGEQGQPLTEALQGATEGVQGQADQLTQGENPAQAVEGVSQQLGQLGQLGQATGALGGLQQQLMRSSLRVSNSKLTARLSTCSVMLKAPLAKRNKSRM